MLMVLMALIEFGRNKVVRFTRWMWLVLSGGLFVTAPVSCSSVGGGGSEGGADASEEEALDNPPQPLYGVDLPVDVVQNDQWSEIPQVEYGPPPYDASQDQYMPDMPPMDVQDAQAEIPQVLYGPVPVDAQDTQADIPQVLYGPVPVDAQEDVPAETGQDTPIQPMYGPQPLYGAQPSD